MSNVKIIPDMPFISLGAETKESPSIRCIAAHAYMKQKSERKGKHTGPLYVTSFDKPSSYVESLELAASELAMKQYLTDNATPDYVFPIMKEISHTVEHPLIQKGLLASNKNEQSSGVTQVRRVKSANVLRPQQRSRGFYRPDTPHQYLPKTVISEETSSGLDRGHGTPTRAQLLRNRMQYSSAPDLSYNYVNQRSRDGSKEALQQKNRMKNAEQALKASKIEMDRTANKYRKFLVGSRYNSSKWVDAHGAMKHGVVTMRVRPNSSFCTRDPPEQVKKVAQTLTGEEDKMTSGLRPSSPAEKTKRKARRLQRRLLQNTQNMGDFEFMSRRTNCKSYSAPVNVAKNTSSLLEGSLTINKALGISVHRISARPNSAQEMKRQIDRKLMSEIEPPINSPRDLAAKTDMKQRIASAPVRRHSSEIVVVKTPPITSTPTHHVTIQEIPQDNMTQAQSGVDTDSFFVTNQSAKYADTEDDISEIENQFVAVKIIDGHTSTGQIADDGSKSQQEMVKPAAEQNLELNETSELIMTANKIDYEIIEEDSKNLTETLPQKAVEQTNEIVESIGANS